MATVFISKPTTSGKTASKKPAESSLKKDVG